ncbi:MAG: shikimate kinase [Clostridia bacterium]|nr:shikimate kinase [Clostridia bacterium]
MNKDLILIGMPGCGKSTLGRGLADELRLPFLDLDAAIEDAAGRPIPEIFETQGEEGFRRLETETFRASVTSGKVIATGGGIVTREENLPIAKNGLVIFIDRPLEHIMGDVQTETRPLLAEGKQRLQKLYEQRYDLYVAWADIRIANTGTPEETLKTIVKEVQAYENHGN